MTARNNEKPAAKAKRRWPELDPQLDPQPTDPIGLRLWKARKRLLDVEAELALRRQDVSDAEAVKENQELSQLRIELRRRGLSPGEALKAVRESSETKGS